MKKYLQPSIEIVDFDATDVLVVSDGMDVGGDWDNNWGFLAAPEVGMLIPFGAYSPFGANVTAGYNFSTNKSTFGNIDIKNRQSLYFNVGLYVAIY
jgi:hypothetical protein